MAIQYVEATRRECICENRLTSLALKIAFPYLFTFAEKMLTLFTLPIAFQSLLYDRCRDSEIDGRFTEGLLRLLKGKTSE